MGERELHFFFLLASLVKGHFMGNRAFNNPRGGRLGHVCLIDVVACIMGGDVRVFQDEGTGRKETTHTHTLTHTLTQNFVRLPPPQFIHSSRLILPTKKTPHTMRLSLALVATLALTAMAVAEESALADAPAEAGAAPANATAAAAVTDAAVEEEAFEPNTIVQKHIGGDVLTLSVL